MHPKNVESIITAMVTRKRFVYTLKNIFEYMLKCLCFRDLYKMRKKGQKVNKHIYINKAEDMLTNELDIRTLLKSNRNLKLVQQVVLSQRNRMLLRFQRQNLIDTTEEDSDSDNNSYDTLKLMQSHNPVVRLMVYGKLKRMVNSFLGDKLKEKEKNLIRGIFANKINDFDLDFKDKIEAMSLLDRLTKGIEDRVDDY